MARPLFDFAAVPWPATADIAFSWGAATAGAGGERLAGGPGEIGVDGKAGDGTQADENQAPRVGAVVAERSGPAVMLHGPVVVSETEPLEIASQLVAAVLDHATAAGVVTLFTRPQSLDRVWVRFGFIPVPESTLPPVLAGRPGAGLYAWRGGSALWTLREAVRE